MRARLPRLSATLDTWDKPVLLALRRCHAVAAVATILAATVLLAGCTGAGAGAPRNTSGPSADHAGIGTIAGTGTGSPPSLSLATFYSQSLDWSDCGDSFQCTRLTVPLDYSAPGGQTIKISVIRLSAVDQGARIGSLIVNPGGPGVSGIGYARAAQSIASDAVRNRYDIVGFDPRGVGISDPVRCADGPFLDKYLSSDGSPDTPAEVDQVVALNMQLVAGCVARSGDLLPHVGTKDVARDLDVLRGALGDKVLYYLGKSYGTFIGSTYAGLFPARVGRMVLDGVLDPASNGEQVGIGQAKGFEQALDSFLGDCVTKSDCPFQGSATDARAVLTGLINKADATPLSSSQGRPVTQSLVVLGIAYPLYERSRGWPLLRVALTAATQGDGSALLQLADQYASRNSDGTYANNSNEVISAVNCFDRPDHSTLSQIEALSVELSKTSPIFGPFLAWGDQICADWPVQSAERPAPITAAGSAPIVLVGTLRDPATPYQWAVNVSKELANGHLITYDGDGHTAYRRGSSCVDGLVDAYLLDGAVPAVDARC